MEIQQFVDSKKELQNIFLRYIDDPDSNQNNFQNLIDCLKSQDLLQNQNELEEFLHFIAKIMKNHRRQPNFFDHIEKVLLYLENDLKRSFTNSEIFTIFKNRKPILLFLIKRKIITVDTSIVKLIRNKEYLQFLYPEIKSFIDDDIERRIGEINDIDEMSKDVNFDEKRRIGENEAYICQLIQSDSIEEFVTFVNQTNMSKNSKIKRSLFETNSFLLKEKETSLIEYAAFFGSIQIFQFLRINEVPLSESLWLYAIHSNNAEMIHILERDKVKPPNGSYGRCFVEAVKCHHNEIARYIKDNYIQENLKDEKYNSSSLQEAAKNNNLDIIYYILSQQEAIKTNYFNRCRYLSKISIPPTIKTIEHSSFKGCTNLTHVSIPPSVTTIDGKAFSKCSLLEQISAPSVVKFGFGTFNECTLLKKVKLSPELRIIYQNLFFGCENLKQINLPPFCTSLGDSSFFRCLSLKHLDIPQTVKSIGSFCFNGCKSLVQLTLPTTLTSIGSHAFAGCKSIKEMTIPASVASLGESVFSACTSLEHIEILCKLNEIKNHVFNACESLKEITIPPSVTSIEFGAFSHCIALTQIIIPPLVKTFGDSVFQDCRSLVKIELPSSLEKIERYAFWGCSAIREISIPSSVIEIGESAFSSCTSLISITIPPSVKSIGKNGFENCTSLAQISIPASINPENLGLSQNTKVTMT